MGLIGVGRNTSEAQTALPWAHASTQTSVSVARLQLQSTGSRRAGDFGRRSVPLSVLMGGDTSRAIARHTDVPTQNSMCAKW